MKIHKNMKDLTDQKFGRLTALEPTDQRMGGNIIWKCLCDCGNESYVAGSNLITGNSKSCGCLKIEIIRRKRGKAAMHNLMCTYRSWANKRNMAFELTENEFEELTKRDCFYCGIKPSRRTGKKTNNGYYFYNGIDRLNNNLGYSVENCVAACGNCNVAKNDMELIDFTDMITRIYQRSNEFIEYT